MSDEDLEGVQTTNKTYNYPQFGDTSVLHRLEVQSQSDASHSESEGVSADSIAKIVKKNKKKCKKNKNFVKENKVNN